MKIRVIDDLNPEDTAMLQALYSRSAASVDEHLEKVKTSGSGKFMSSYYVGYGHKSIADCGSTTIFIEGVSLLAAKAIQDWPLYSGQETSTRYIDMSKQPIIAPYAHNEIHEEWMRFYTSKRDVVAKIVRLRHPRGADEREDLYDRAVKARTFDILRAFLPAGITTQLSWHTNLRQAGDHLAWLSWHPLPEVREVANQIRVLLAEKYPSSGNGLSLPQVAGVEGKDAVAAAERELWLRNVSEEWTYNVRSNLTHDLTVCEFELPSELALRANDVWEIIETRPRGCVLPHFMADFGTASVEFPLDFGSFRDLQRHRNGVMRMPMLDTTMGFHRWYLEQLGDLRDEACELIHMQETRIRMLDLEDSLKQYYCALGFKVPCQFTMALPALVYLMELRSSKTVHPTLRARVHELIAQFAERYPNFKLHVDNDPDSWDVRRGAQTISQK